MKEIKKFSDKPGWTKKRVIVTVVVVALILGLIAGTGYYYRDELNEQVVSKIFKESSSSVDNSESKNNKTEDEDTIEKQEILDVDEEEPTPEEAEEAPEEVEETSQEEAPVSRGVIAIDAGHQLYGNSDQEPNGPGSSIMKAKVTSGTRGVSTGIPEYVLNLEVALKLQAELESRGYTVVMVRTTHEVDISNSQRAQVANNAGADAFIRIHANGGSATASGAITMCQTASNPYNSSLYAQSRALSDCVLDGMVAEMGCVRGGVQETDTMTGINWATVPVTIVEMGFMTNPDEDYLMSTDDYRNKIVTGIANGIDAFMGY